MRQRIKLEKLYMSNEGECWCWLQMAVMSMVMVVVVAVFLNKYDGIETECAIKKGADVFCLVRVVKCLSSADVSLP